MRVVVETPHIPIREIVKKVDPVSKSYELQDRSDNISQDYNPDQKKFYSTDNQISQNKETGGLIDILA